MSRKETSSSVSKAISASKGAIIAIAAFSLVLNILMLTGPMFMLQVYDRVLTSHSVPTLLALGGITLLLYGFYGFFDMIRSWLTSRVGAAFDRRLSESAFNANALAPLRARHSREHVNPVGDVEQVRSFISGQGLSALFDLPWVPLYLAIIYLLHPLLGLLGLFGALILLCSTLCHEWITSRTTRSLVEQRAADSTLVEAARRNTEVLSAMGMLKQLRARWMVRHNKALQSQQRLIDLSAFFSSFTKSARFLLQSGALALGAFLAIKGELSPGSMIAASIILARALAPVEQVVGQWRQFASARLSFKKLRTLLPLLETQDATTELPAPKNEVLIKNLVVVAPGGTEPVLKNINYVLSAGDALGIIGPSGAGKTTMVRALLGTWPASRGEVRLDGALLEHFKQETLGAAVGYLPQDVELFDGTIAENIARFNPSATSEEIVAAAKMAGCHDMILGFAGGYDTEIGSAGRALSGGQRQRIGLARALYGNPFLVVLDEPNSNLDQEGEAALHHAIKQLRERGSIAVIVAHRPSALSSVNKVLALQDGVQTAFGIRDDVLAKLFSNRKADQNPALKVVKQ